MKLESVLYFPMLWVALGISILIYFILIKLNSYLQPIEFNKIGFKSLVAGFISLLIVNSIMAIFITKNLPEWIITFAGMMIIIGSYFGIFGISIILISRRVKSYGFIIYFLLLFSIGISFIIVKELITGSETSDAIIRLFRGLPWYLIFLCTNISVFYYFVVKGINERNRIQENQ